MGTRLSKCLIFLLFTTNLFANVESLLKEESKNSCIPYKYLLALTKTESSLNPTAKGKDETGNGYSYGLMQIKLSTAKDMGFKGTLNDLFIPKINIKYSVRYLNWLCEYYNGDIFKAMDAYNRGIGNVNRWPWRKEWKQHRYVGKIIKRLK